jgi:predicted dehydrogenase
MNPVRIAVVGCGYWGPNLVRNFLGFPDCEVAGICDTSHARLQHMLKLYPNLATFPSVDALLAEPSVDAVVIATPVRHHHAIAKQCLAAGKHVLVEKPMAASSAQCRELSGLARERGLTLMVGHTFLFSPNVRKIKEIIASGEIGDIHYISARRLNLGLFQEDINVVWDLAPHDISIIEYLMDELPCAVNCQGNSNVTSGIEDICNTTLSFRSGRFATIQSSWLDPRKTREMTIVGTRKMIVYDDLETLHKIRIYDQRVENHPHYNNFAEFHYAYYYGDIHVPYVKQEEPLQVECRHFVDCIVSQATPLTSAEQGTNIVRVLEASSHSLRQGGARVAVPLEHEAR